MSVKTKALSEKLLRVVRDQPVCVEESATVREALTLMRERQTSCLMVCRGRRLVGIFTERDFLMKAAGRAKPRDPIRSYMTPSPDIARLEQTVGEAIEVMNEKGFRNLPLVDEGGSPASLVTVNGIIRYLADHFPAAVVNRPPQPHLISEEMDGA